MKKIQFYLFIFFVSSYSFGQTSHISKKDIFYLNKQNYFFGKHVSLIQAKEDTVYFFESIEFKYKTDSFYYWQHPNVEDDIEGYGKGTYKIEGDKLLLNFENTGLVKPTFTRYNLQSEPESIKNTRVITIQSFDSSGMNVHSAGELILLNKNNDTIHMTKLSMDESKNSLSRNNDSRMPFVYQRYFINDTDFPITVKSTTIWYKPFMLLINNPNNYKLNVFFQKLTYMPICNGEKWEFQFKDFSVQKFTIQRLSNDRKYLSKTFYNSTYNIAKPNQQILYNIN